ncbi:MAG: hypothetical protein WCS73_01265 [Lentisphaeria bacterium]
MEEKKSTTSKSFSCPDSETLSEFVDNPSSTEIAEHIKMCSVCRQKVEAYIQIQQLIAGISQPPEDLVDKILIKTTRNNHGVAPQRFRHFPWIRFAAAIVATAMITAYFTKKQTASPNEMMNQTMASSSPTQAYSSNKSEQTAIGTRNTPSINTGPMQNVSTESASSIEQNTIRKYLPASQVTHIWSMEKIPGAQKYLDSLVKGEKLTWKHSNGILTTSLILSDQDLQQLIDNLYHSGWSLLSPFYPQPEASDVTIFTGKKICYNLKLIQQ